MCTLCPTHSTSTCAVRVCSDDDNWTFNKIILTFSVGSARLSVSERAIHFLFFPLADIHFVSFCFFFCVSGDHQRILSTHDHTRMLHTHMTIVQCCLHIVNVKKMWTKDATARGAVRQRGRASDGPMEIIRYLSTFRFRCRGRGIYYSNYYCFAIVDIGRLMIYCQPRHIE